MANHGPKNFRHGESEAANSGKAQQRRMNAAFIRNPVQGGNRRFIDRDRRFRLYRCQAIRFQR
jgi:hypothetical protein